MKRFKFEILLAVAYAAFLLWTTPTLWRAKLTRPEIDRYITIIDQQLYLPGKAEALQRLRTWAEADDGRPVYMLNLMRQYPTLNRYPGAPDFQGTLEASNRYYESKATSLLLKTASYPLFGGKPQGPCVLPASNDPRTDTLTRVLVVRYTSRRAFLDLVSDPAYAPIEPYKVMAFETALLPMGAETVIPDPRVVLGLFLLGVYLATGWIRAVRRARPNGTA
jgi:hypothetical protein